LPLAAWRLPELDGGRLSAFEPEAAIIRANRAIDNGVWYEVASGVRAVLLRDADGREVVYPLVEPASHYYRSMTESEWMPCLLRQRI
jgi:hypothetical protein